MSIARTSRDLDAVAVLGDPVRRALYKLVAASAEPVTRNSAAAALSLPRSTVAFHLDRLAEAGLLDVDHRRLGDRTGPGSGRPSKLYRRTAAELTVSLPPRRYDLMGDLLASALEQSAGEPPIAVLRSVAATRGRTAGAAAGSLETVLAHVGYEPVRDGSGTTLANCPFHVLAAAHAELVCAANHAYLGGVADGAGADSGRVRLVSPSGGRCCIRIDDPGPPSEHAANTQKLRG